LVGAALILGGAVFSELLRQRVITTNGIKPAAQAVE